MAGENRINHRRLKLLSIIVLLFVVGIVLKLSDLMILQAESISDRAESQWTREMDVIPKRGEILDRNGEVLAASTTVKSVMVYPKNIKDSGEVADLLAPILAMDRQEVFELVSDTSKVEVWLKRHITAEQEEEIRKLDLAGVDFFADVKRVYPYGSFMSQVIGYTTIDGVGQEGLEKKYNKYLTGYTGTVLRLVDAQGRSIDGIEQVYVEAEDGLNINLTLDAVIQSISENAAKEALEVNRAKSVCAIVMDPTNCDILAMVNYPEADLNNLNRNDLTELADLSRNTAVTDAFEPGSIFKVVTLASALDSGSVSMESHFYCGGSKLVDGEKIKCWRSYNPHGSQTLSEAAQNSCNPAFMEMALGMGTETFYKYIYAFGFGNTTGVDYSADAAGIVRAPKYVKTVDLARIGFGQSIAVTPLQMITAASATVNGGILYTPRLVSHLTDENNETVKTFDTKEVRRVISEETSAEVRQILESVVLYGSGKNAQIAGYRVGGKTGTAQMYENGVIVQGKNISSFIGFAPANDPKYIVLFIVKEPQVYVTFGSVVAAPYAKDILEQCLKYGKVDPTEAVEELVRVPNLTGKSLEDAKELAKADGLSVTNVGEGDSVLAQSPAAGTEVKKATVVELYFTGFEPLTEDVSVPTVEGLSASQAFKALNEAGFDMEIIGELGNGVIASQSPAPNTKAAYGASVSVTCEE